MNFLFHLRTVGNIEAEVSTKHVDDELRKSFCIRNKHIDDFLYLFWGKFLNKKIKNQNKLQYLF